jgi:HEAT repeats
VVATAYHEGDSREKKAVVQGLSLLPEAYRFLDLALDAGRRAETTLFHAVACDNPFPARHYPELEFNKLVMKAAFVGAPIARIVGRERRANPELARMAMDHVSEQESAVRRFDPQIWLAVAAFPPPGAVGRMVGYLSHSVAEQRLWAARALRRVGQERTRSFLQERAAVEADADVLQAVLEALGGPS